MSFRDAERPVRRYAIVALFVGLCGFILSHAEQAAKITFCIVAGGFAIVVARYAWYFDLARIPF